MRRTKPKIQMKTLLLALEISIALSKAIFVRYISSDRPAFFFKNMQCCFRFLAHKLYGIYNVQIRLGNHRPFKKNVVKKSHPCSDTSMSIESSIHYCNGLAPPLPQYGDNEHLKAGARIDRCPESCNQQF